MSSPTPGTSSLLTEATTFLGPTETSPLLPKNVVENTLPGLTDSSVNNEVEGSSPTQGNQDVEENAEVEADENAKYREGIDTARRRMKYVFPAIAVGVFLAAADQTIIATSYGTIGSDLRALNKTSWVATAYYLTLTPFQPLYGKMSDIFGRKACLLFAYTVFGIGCLLCGLSLTIDQLIFGRAFAGIGGGGMTTIVSILLSDIVPLRERGTWNGYINIIWATGAAIGAPFGGVIADFASWRWSFLAQVPLCAVSFVAVQLALQMPEREESRSNWKAKLAGVDFWGALVLLTAVSMLLVGLDRGSNSSWADQTTVTCLSIAVPFFMLFGYVEARVAPQPFAPPRILFERSIFAAYSCLFFSLAGWLAAIFYIPLYFQAVHGKSATQASVLLIPNIIAGVSGSLFGGFYMQHTGRYYWLTIFAYSSLVVGMTMILVFSGAGSILGMVAGMTLCGFSNGIGITSSLIALIANAGRVDQAIATACSYLFRSLGSVFGIAVSATALNQTLRALLRDRLQSGDAEAIAERVRHSLDYLKKLDPATQRIVRECYGQSTRAAFAVEVVLVFGAALSAWWIREKDLSR